MDEAMHPCVYIVEDDDEHRRALAELIESAGLQVCTFAKPSDSLQSVDKAQPGCVIVDIRLPEMSGLALIERFAPLPVIVVTGFGDVQVAVRSLKKGAAEFLEKPVHHQLMIDTVQKLVNESTAAFIAERTAQQLRVRVESLSGRQIEVITKVLLGASNKEIGLELGLSPRTVEKHRLAARDRLGDLTAFPPSMVLKELLRISESRPVSPTTG